MAKESTQYVCQGCGSASPRWLGRCPSCGGWNTLVEETVEKAPAKARERLGRGDAPGERGKPIAIDAVPEDGAARIPTGIAELDRVLGGGAVLGSVVLVGGDPGVGKSTLLLQALAGIAARGPSTLYASGEESVAQVALRARRLGVVGDGKALGEKLQIVGCSVIDEVERATRATKPVALVVDSVQVLRSNDLESAAGSVSQLREVTARLVELAKRERAAVFLVGHVTKDGALAGPKVLEHLVDVVLAFEGERGHAFRTLRAAKNRFGSATEVGVFEMSANGLAEVPNPSEIFLAERPAHAAGSVVAPVTPQTGGARAVLGEVQALVSIGGQGGVGRRVATGVDGTRLALILAVLERKVGVQLLGADVFANVAGGLSIDEPAIDLPLAIAVASAVRNRPCARNLVAFGEVGLAGEVRGVSRASTRLAEAASMGFSRAIAPRSTAERLSPSERSGVEVIPVRDVDEAVRIALEE